MDKEPEKKRSVRMTPLDIRRQRFRKAMRGYDPAEVEAFLEMLAGAWEELTDGAESRERELSVLRARASDFDRMESAVREALVVQQRSASKAREDAEKEAELIVMDGEVKAANLVNEARERMQVLMETVRELQDRRMAIIAQMRAFLTAQDKMLELEEGRIREETLPERERLPDEEEGDGPILELSEL
ncbi:DivIVA domain-containing protein [Candidatus Fermentibacterales bacterium]|nr:DivIVA domain-containing protein [Candidatus Fermentibacterales bacterium]